MSDNGGKGWRRPVYERGGKKRGVGTRLIWWCKWQWQRQQVVESAAIVAAPAAVKAVRRVGGSQCFCGAGACVGNGGKGTPRRPRWPQKGSTWAGFYALQGRSAEAGGCNGEVLCEVKCCMTRFLQRSFAA